MEYWDEIDLFEVIDHFSDIDRTFSSSLADSVYKHYKTYHKITENQRLSLENLIKGFDMQNKIRKYYDSQVTMSEGEEWLPMPE